MKYPVDYCVIALNEIKPFIKLQFETLTKPNPSINALGNEEFGSFASFHIVDKETNDGTIEYCRNAIPDIQIHSLDYYHVQNRTNIQQPSFWQWDMAYSMHYAIENCGDSEWTFLTHPDIVYWNPKQFFEGLWKLATDDVGVIWDGGSALIRRKAFFQSHMGFWPLLNTQCRVAPNGFGYLVNDRDVRFLGTPIIIMGIEAGELFRMEMSLLGWSVLFMPYSISKLKEHTGGSTMHDINMDNPNDRNLWNSKMALVHSRLEGYGGI